jgi:pilus assembly protein Flp/PilA
MKKIQNFLRDDSGAALAEYGLLVALIAVVCVAAVTLLGGNVSKALNYAATKITTP